MTVFTAAHGRHAGVVRGGRSRKMAPMLQPGAQLDLAWRARLEEPYRQLLPSNLMRSRGGHQVMRRLALAGLNTVTALLTFCLPEREACPAFYQRTEQLLMDLTWARTTLWPLAYHPLGNRLA